VLVAAQLCVTAWLAFGTPHNGWLWYSGGDATEYWTSQWTVAHGLVPQAYIGWGLSVFYAWVPLVAGTTLLGGLPAIVLLQVLILAPLALVLVWSIADRMFGRLFAWGAASTWVVGPPIAAAAFTARYRPLFEQAVLAPHWAGLTDMADFASIVAVLAAAWTAIRSIENGRFTSAVGAGVVGGVMIGLKPSNGFFVVALAALYAVWRRPVLALGWIVGVVPALLTLIIWKQRGLGTLPLFSLGHGRPEAAGGALLAVSLGQYVPFSGHHLRTEWSELGQVFWDVRVLQFVFVAGIVGVLRRNWRWGLFVAVWFVAYCFVKGSSSQADVTTTSYFRLTLPGIATLALLVPGVACLWPGTTQRTIAIAAESRKVEWRSPLAWLAVAVAVVPLVVVLAIRQPAQPPYVRSLAASTEAPVSSRLTPSIHASNGRARLTWRPIDSTRGAAVTYAVYRTRTPCDEATNRVCFLISPPVGFSHDGALVDRPGKGRFTYRVAVTANYLRQPDSTDLMAISPPVTVSVP
jgi:hypothetical protein